MALTGDYPTLDPETPVDAWTYEAMGSKITYEPGTLLRKQKTLLPEDFDMNRHLYDGAIPAMPTEGFKWNHSQYTDARKEDLYVKPVQSADPSASIWNRDLPAEQPGVHKSKNGIIIDTTTSIINPNREKTIPELLAQAAKGNDPRSAIIRMITSRDIARLRTYKLDDPVYLRVALYIASPLEIFREILKYNVDTSCITLKSIKQILADDNAPVFALLLDEQNTGLNASDPELLETAINAEAARCCYVLAVQGANVMRSDIVRIALNKSHDRLLNHIINEGGEALITDEINGIGVNTYVLDKVLSLNLVVSDKALRECFQRIYTTRGRASLQQFARYPRAANIIEQMMQ